MTLNRNSAFLILGATAGLMGLLGCDKADLSNDKGKYSYAIGVQIGRNLKDQNIDLDTKSFNAGVADVYANKESQLKEEDRVAALRKMSESLRAKETAAGEENKKKGEAFLAENAKKEGWKTTASGLQYHQVREGSGEAPKPDDTVEVNYAGKLIDGKEFDSSYKRNQPAQFPVKAVIPGWTEALQLMKPGSKYELVIPSALAYGERGNPSIPPNSTLIFDVELLKILPPQPGGEGGGLPPGHPKPAGKAKKK